MPRHKFGSQKAYQRKNANKLSIIITVGANQIFLFGIARYYGANHWWRLNMDRVLECSSFRRPYAHETVV